VVLDFPYFFVNCFTVTNQRPLLAVIILVIKLNTRILGRISDNLYMSIPIYKN
jgi:hypothetical protein